MDGIRSQFHGVTTRHHRTTPEGLHTPANCRERKIQKKIQKKLHTKEKYRLTWNKHSDKVQNLHNQGRYGDTYIGTGTLSTEGLQIQIKARKEF